MYPILFKIPYIHMPIYSYGVMLGLSIVIGWYLVAYMGVKEGFKKEILGECYVWTAIAAIAGSRVLYILTNPQDYSDGNIIDMINIRKGGLVAYGGFIGGFLGSWIYLKRKKINLLPWADMIAPTLGSGLGITRIGCLMFGCDYGKPIASDAPSWIQTIGLKFPNWETAFPESTKMFHEGIGCMNGNFSGSPAFLHHVNDGLVQMVDLESLLVLPTQLISSANGWIAFAIAMLIRKKTYFRGQAFLFIVGYYGITRSLIEILRGDGGRGSIDIFSTSQIIGISTFFIAVVTWIILSKRAKKDPKGAMSLGPGVKLN